MLYRVLPCTYPSPYRQLVRIACFAMALMLPNSNLFAAPISAQARPGFDLSGVDQRSYDGIGFNAFSPYASITDGTIYSLDTIVGEGLGTNLDFFMLTEFACFDGRFAQRNQFGGIDSSGAFQSVIDTQTLDPLASGSVSLAAGEEFTVALNSPEGLFSSIDSENADRAAHILALRVDTASTIKLPQTRVVPTDELAFDLLPGDYILFIEDLLGSGNNTFGGLVPLAGDFDYNDMVLVVRASQIPEPATGLLLLSAIGAYAARRRRS